MKKLVFLLLFAGCFEEGDPGMPDPAGTRHCPGQVIIDGYGGGVCRGVARQVDSGTDGR